MHERSIPLWSLECRLPSGQYTGTTILGRHGENALNEYSLLVRHWLIYEEAISRQPLLTRDGGSHVRRVSSRWALTKRIEQVSAVPFLSLSCASETLRLISGFVP